MSKRDPMPLAIPKWPRRHAKLALCCLALLGAAHLAWAACPQLTWSPPVPVFPAETGREVWSFDAIETPDARLHVVFNWSGAGTEGRVLYWATRASNGAGGWSAPQRLDPLGTALVEEAPELSVAGDGTLALLFRRSSPTSTVLTSTWSALLSPHADAWSTPALLPGIPTSWGQGGWVAVTADSLWVFAVDETQLRGWPIVAGQVSTPLVESGAASWAFEYPWGIRASRTQAGQILVWWSDEAYGGLDTEIAYTWLDASGFGDVQQLTGTFGPNAGDLVENAQNRAWFAFDYPSHVGIDASVHVAERDGAGWTSAVLLAGGHGPAQPSTGCLGAWVGLLADGRPLVAYSCFVPPEYDSVRLYTSALGGAAWCQPQSLWASAPDLSWLPNADLVTRAGNDPVLAYTEYQDHRTILVTEVIESVGIGSDSTGVRAPEPSMAGATALSVSYTSPREIRFCRGAADGPLGIELFDVAGRRVTTLRHLEDAAAACASWHALDAGGRPVAAGIYFYRARDLREPRRVVAAGKLPVLAP